LEYYGVDDAVFHFSKGTAFTYDLLRQYLQLFSLGDTPIFKYHQLICSTYADGCNEESKTFVSYNTWKASWVAYMKSLDIKYEYGFQCPHCDEHPSVVIVDGTSLGHRKDLATGQSDLTEPTSNSIPFRQMRYVLNMH
jgi:hypothetical protein